ncbi:MAG: autotransporter domain-containing protein [Burkholderiales bacterium]|nr:autotransporter domain-containing protein [Burkholderiales bacterium]MDE2433759.1 autotransporter domain-containing protein [Burkholderiales bacterium]
MPADAALLVTGTTASSITQTTAVLSATVQNTSGFYNVDESFQWGLTTSYGSTGSITTVPPYGYQTVTQSISGLACGTTYHFAITHGPDTTFTTSACGSSVIYDANGGSGAPVDGTSYANGSTVTVSSTNPTRATYTFTNWNTAANGSGTAYASGTTFTMGGSNVTLYAQWLGTQSALTVTASPSALRTHQTSVLSTSGGSGSGAVSYAVASGPCTVSGNVLTANDRGTCVITATKAADASYTAASASTSVTVGSSIDQAVDQSVRNTITAQGAVAIRTTELQLHNVNTHLSQLSQDFDIHSNRFAFNDPLVNLGRVMLASASDHLSGMGSQLQDRTHAAVWIAGDLSFGKTDNSQNVAARFSTNEVTVGLDVQVDAKSIVGAAISYSKDDTSTDNHGSKVNGQQRAISLYGVTSLQRDWIVDGQMGLGKLALDSDRYSALANDVFSSNRDGHSLFIAGGLHKKIVVSGWKLQPFVRAQHITTKLGAYNEGLDASALAYGSASINANSVFAGIESSYEINLNEGAKLTPSVKAEYRYNAHSTLHQGVWMNQDPSEATSVSMAAVPQNVRTVGAGVQFTNKNTVSATLNWQFSQGNSGYQATGLRTEISAPF